MTTPKSTTPKTFCFVLMPFREDFDDVYHLGIKDACTSAGAYCERVDEQIFQERILDRIYNQIAKADLVIADMTGRNPNVFYEVGYAHALGKLTILLTKDSDDIPFDLKHFPHIVYGTKISTLRNELEKRVKFFIENPPTKASESKLKLELYIEDQNLTSGRTVHVFFKGAVASFEITVFNTSGETFAPGDFKIGVLTTDERLSVRALNKIATTRLPTGGYLHMLPDLPTLFPNAYASDPVALMPKSEDRLSIGEEVAAVVRLFTKQGNWDFPVTLQRRDS